MIIAVDTGRRRRWLVVSFAPNETLFFNISAPLRGLGAAHLSGRARARTLRLG